MVKSIRPPPREVSSGTNAIPYIKEALEQDLARVHDAWDDSQTDRRRDAIYGYLKSVYDLLNWWSAERAEVDRTRQALRSRGLLPSPREDVYASIIRCTADPVRADKRTRSKWGRALRYAKMQKDEKEPVTEFIKRRAASTNALFGTADASGDLLQEGDQSLNFNAVRQATERRWFAGQGRQRSIRDRHDAVIQKWRENPVSTPRTIAASCISAPTRRATPQHTGPRLGQPAANPERGPCNGETSRGALVMRPPRDYGRNPIGSAPHDEDIVL
jgi:hypothetical protein